MAKSLLDCIDDVLAAGPMSFMPALHDFTTQVFQV